MRVSAHLLEVRWLECGWNDPLHDLEWLWSTSIHLYIHHSDHVPLISIIYIEHIQYINFLGNYLGSSYLHVSTHKSKVVNHVVNVILWIFVCQSVYKSSLDGHLKLYNTLGKEGMTCLKLSQLRLAWPIYSKVVCTHLFITVYVQ